MFANWMSLFEFKVFELEVFELINYIYEILLISLSNLLITSCEE